MNVCKSTLCNNVQLKVLLCILSHYILIIVCHVLKKCTYFDVFVQYNITNSHVKYLIAILTL